VRLWDGGELVPDVAGPPRFTLVFHHPAALGRMVLDRSDAALGEAYIWGAFDIEGDIIAAFDLADVVRNVRLAGWERLRLAVVAFTLRAGRGTPTTQVRCLRAPARLVGRLHSRARDQAAISYHYDVSNAFYALWLDRRMVYSCAYFPTGTETLDEAQEHKLEHICRKLRLRPGERLLDIGCGWGGLCLYAAERYGVDATGVTLSRRQAELAAQRIAAAGLARRCRVVLCDYRDLRAGPQFDKIASIGMFEHVGRAELARYFAQVRDLLRPGGLFLNHGIASQPGTFPRHGPGRSFIDRYVFPDGELLPVSETVTAMETAGFEIRDVESLREHYVQTLRHWVAGLEAWREEVVATTNEATYRTWRLYMAGAAHAFQHGRLNLYQVLAVWPRPDGHCELPPTRADLYA
jgi:cyclopropane-fatty-acyl-phospholipid synthase